jgi:hypothetical protein
VGLQHYNYTPVESSSTCACIAVDMVQRQQICLKAEKDPM